MAREHSACGVGFVAGRDGLRQHSYLRQALFALSCVEHRGACGADGITGDGAGIMADIPFELFGYPRGEMAVATLFVSAVPARRRVALKCFEETLKFLDLEIIDYRPVPVIEDVLGPQARDDMPYIVQVMIRRPTHIRTDEAFNAELYFAKQTVRSKLKALGAFQDLFFVSLSTTTVVYKALTRASDLPRFYPDLVNPEFKTRFALFHRRFSTNTRTSWDRAQPFRLVAHNGEINTITGNLSWSYSREQVLGLRRDELLTHADTSDSGNLNEQVEALRYRSSMPHLEDVLAIMVPPADTRSPYYQFWGRAMEPWDGPAFITYSDGESVGARLDRNGFRPCRWAATDNAFYLASEAGIFDLDETQIRAKGTLNAGRGVRVNLETGEIQFRDPSRSRENNDAHFEARLLPLPNGKNASNDDIDLDRAFLFGLTRDEVERCLLEMAKTGAEPIGSMGDTAQLALFSDQRRSLYDFMFQNFAQVTNPPLDYVRERIVTDMSTVLGRQPNIFAPKELLPPTPAYALSSPLLSNAQLNGIVEYGETTGGKGLLRTGQLDAVFDRDAGAEGLTQSLERLSQLSIDFINEGRTILVITDRQASSAQPPIPSLLALRTVVNTLNRHGLRLKASIILDSADIRTTHHFACAIGFGATAVCPYFAWAIAERYEHRTVSKLSRDRRHAHYRKAMENGLLKIMSKVGISAVRSYCSAKLFTPLGLGPDLVSRFFPGLSSPIGGLELVDIADRVLRHTECQQKYAITELPMTYRFQERRRGGDGEKHDMTAARATVVHQLVQAEDPDVRTHHYQEYLEQGIASEPMRLSHLLAVRRSTKPISIDEVESVRSITRRFGSGAMSFGALSAEAQRDIFHAMAEVGGRSNSGEGGENPYYFVDGTRATTKQVASGRFGVTAEYLMTGNEIEIKLAQGAKPGEGGQLMGIKVNADIARARHAHEGVDLISPPPLHDIYSIEDLKELIYELRQLHPQAHICVKLVAGANIGNIAVGVVKAGADIIQVSGGSGGTGAASLSSMMHAGLPWELGLVEVHQTLLENRLRDRVRLRVDGGLHVGMDLIIAALLGADEYGFGKLLLVAQGCIMARICEKNRCPRGIATHDVKFKNKYRGRVRDIVTMLDTLAEDVRGHLASMGVSSLSDIIGQANVYLRPRSEHLQLIEDYHLDLTAFLHGTPNHVRALANPSSAARTINPLNQEITTQVVAAIDRDKAFEGDFDIRSTDRAIPATLSGILARRTHELRMERLDGVSSQREALTLEDGRVRLNLTGSAGQGFGAFMVEGLDIRLRGEANDSVAKSMSGGRLVIQPVAHATFEPHRQVILGNCALYGATGGTLMVHGRAGDRFAVRNSGATAIVEGAGLHACEYMTSGTVVILGEVSYNIGAGMTGGVLYLRESQAHRVNNEYCGIRPLTPADTQCLQNLLTEYTQYTQSETAAALLRDVDALDEFVCCLPLKSLVQAESDAKGVA